MSDYIASLIRTAVPAAVAFAVVWLGNLGVTDIDQPTAVAAVTSIVMAVYYAAVRKLEEKVPSLGWLLGLPRPPSYES